MKHGKCSDKIFHFHNRTMLLLDMIWNVIFLIFVVPVINYVLVLIMRLWGQSYITLENILSFLSFPPTVLFLVILLIVILLFLQFKLTTLIHYCNTEGTRKRSSLFRIISFGTIKTLHGLRKGSIGLMLFTIPYYIFTNLPILIGVTAFADLDFVHGADDEIIMKVFLILFLFIISFISFQGSFVFHFCMNEHLGFIDSLEHSKMLLRNRSRRTGLTFMVVNLSLILGFFLLYYLILLISALAVYLFTEKSIVITVFLSVYPKINLSTTVVFCIISFITNINLISSLYFTYQEENFEDIQPVDTQWRILVPLRVKKHKYVVNGLILLVIASGIINFYLSIKNDTLSINEAIAGIRIASHRGNSHVAPENTIPALDNAILAESDYAEIDVRQTKDGVLVLLHDTSLRRTAGVNQYIWELTYDEISHLDVGTWFDQKYKNTHIPTLEEAMIFCKGKIKLNIEVKIHGHEYRLEEKLVELIRKHEYEHQCIISSTNYNTLINIKLLNEELRTGYVLSAAYGDFYNKNFVDFFSIRFNFINKNVVENSHRVGKEVHAWTVNSSQELERMKSLGVDCIVTDRPTLAREVLFHNDKNDTFIQLLNRMLRNRSFYRIIQIIN